MSEGGSKTVTPEGIRDGDPFALRGLCRRRSGSVLDYARTVCAPEGAIEATAEAFARFRAAVAAADDPRSLHPETLLLGCTRHAAAALVRPAGDLPECPSMPMLFVGRREGMLSPAEVQHLGHHLIHCPACRTLDAAFHKAEHIYRQPHPADPPPEVEARVLAALVAAAPVTWVDPDGSSPVVAPAPVPVDEPEPEPADDDERAPWDEAEDEAREESVAALPVAPSTPEVPSAEDEPFAEDEPYAEDDPFDDGPLAVEEPTAVHPPEAVLAPAAGPLPTARGRRLGLLPRIVVPAAILTIATTGAMAYAGVFGGVEGEPARGTDGLPAPAPPKRAPIASEAEQEKAAAAFRRVLAEIEVRDRARAARAARERREERERREREKAAEEAEEAAAAAPAAPAQGDEEDGRTTPRQRTTTTQRPSTSREDTTTPEPTTPPPAEAVPEPAPPAPTPPAEGGFVPGTVAP
jgi:hypothetical protein